MALVFHRRLAIPLWATAFFTVALTAPPPATLPVPPTTLFVIAAVGIAAIVFSMPGAIPWLRRKKLATPAPLATRRASPIKPHFVLDRSGPWRPCHHVLDFCSS